MEITYLGHSSFRIKGKTAAVVIDPYDEKTGKYPKEIEADILLVSHDHPDHNAAEKVGGQKFKISGPGEYEVKGVSVIGIPSFHDDKGGVERGTNTIYVIEMDGLRLAHLGDLGHKITQTDMEEMGSIDILFVPVGGFFTIDAKSGAEVVRQIDPWIVVPMHYQQEGATSETGGKLAKVDEFLKEMGKTEIQPVPKLTISADRLPTEMQVVVLEKK